MENSHRNKHMVSKKTKEMEKTKANLRKTKEIEEDAVN